MRISSSLLSTLSANVQLPYYPVVPPTKGGALQKIQSTGIFVMGTGAVESSLLAACLFIDFAVLCAAEQQLTFCCN